MLQSPEQSGPKVANPKPINSTGIASSTSNASNCDLKPHFVCVAVSSLQTLNVRESDVAKSILPNAALEPLSVQHSPCRSDHEHYAKEADFLKKLIEEGKRDVEARAGIPCLDIECPILKDVPPCTHVCNSVYQFSCRKCNFLSHVERTLD